VVIAKGAVYHGYRFVGPARKLFFGPVALVSRGELSYPCDMVKIKEYGFRADNSRQWILDADRIGAELDRWSFPLSRGFDRTPPRAGPSIPIGHSQLPWNQRGSGCFLQHDLPMVWMESLNTLY